MGLLGSTCCGRRRVSKLPERVDWLQETNGVKKMKFPRLSSIAAAVMLSGLAVPAMAQDAKIEAPAMTAAEKEAAKKTSGEKIRVQRPTR